MTQNPFLMSLVGIGWMLPQIVLGPIAGVIVDRFAKRGIMYLSDMIRFVITFLVTFLAFTHLLTPLEMIVVAFASNIVATVFNPAAGAITPRIVQEDQLATANGLEQAMTPIAMILGPALSAGLISLVGVSASFGFNAITFLISFITIFFLRVNEPPKERKPFTATHLFAEMKEGIVEVRKIRLLMVLFPIAFLLNFLFAPFDLYFIQLVTNVLHGNQVLVGELNAIFAFGMLLGALVTGFVGKWMRGGQVVGFGLFVSTLFILLVGLFPYTPFVMVAMVIAGIGMSLTNVTISTLLQKVVPKEVMGRVFSLLGTVFGAAMPLGMLIGGVVAARFPILPVIIGIGVFGVILSVITLALPSMRHSISLSSKNEEEVIVGVQAN